VALHTSGNPASLESPHSDSFKEPTTRRTELLIDRGETSYRSGEMARALACYRKALEIDPENARALVNLALIEIPASDIPAGLTHLVKALLSDSEYCQDVITDEAPRLRPFLDTRVLDFLATLQGGSIPPRAFAIASILLGIARTEDPFTEGNNDFSRQGRRHFELCRFLDNQGIARSGEVLDVGCGPGYLASRLFEKGFCRLSGCDRIAFEDLDPRIRNVIDFHRIDLNQEGLSFYQDSSFDLVLASDVLEHLENPAKILREMARVLKPGGDIFISLPNAFNIFERLHILRTGNSSRYARSAPARLGHISLFPRDVLQSLCERVGLEIRETGRGSVFWERCFWFWEQDFDPLYSYVSHYRLRQTTP